MEVYRTISGCCEVQCACVYHASEAHAAVAVTSLGSRIYCGNAVAFRCSVTVDWPADASSPVDGDDVDDTAKGVPRPLRTTIEAALSVASVIVTGSTSL